MSKSKIYPDAISYFVSKEFQDDYKKLTTRQQITVKATTKSMFGIDVDRLLEVRCKCKKPVRDWQS